MFFSTCRSCTGNVRHPDAASLPPGLPLALFALNTVLLFLAGCAASIPGAGLGPEADFERGRQLYEERRFHRAVEVLESFRYDHPGSDRVDDALFYLAKSHQGLGENLLAREEFRRLLRDFPHTRYREEAVFELAMSWLADMRNPGLDPEPTLGAMDAFHAYLRQYPDGRFVEEASRHEEACRDRLAVKAFDNGRTYVRLRRPEAAVIYFEKSLEVHPESSRAGAALYGLGQAHEALEDSAAAVAAYRRLIEYADEGRIEADPSLAALKSRALRGLERMDPPQGGEGS